MYIFVYGTLMPGGSRAGYLEPYVDDMGVAGNVSGRLYDAGTFPAACYDGESDSLIHGIVYQVKKGMEETILERLDPIEGYPRLFDRLPVPVQLTTGAMVMATMYVGAVDSLFKTIIMDGRWSNSHEPAV